MSLSSSVVLPLVPPSCRPAAILPSLGQPLTCLPVGSGSQHPFLTFNLEKWGIFCHGHLRASLFVLFFFFLFHLAHASHWPVFLSRKTGLGSSLDRDLSLYLRFLPWVGCVCACSWNILIYRARACLLLGHPQCYYRLTDRREALEVFRELAQDAEERASASLISGRLGNESDQVLVTACELLNPVTLQVLWAQWVLGASPFTSQGTGNRSHLMKDLCTRLCTCCASQIHNSNGHAQPEGKSYTTHTHCWRVRSGSLKIWIQPWFPTNYMVSFLSFHSVREWGIF